MNSLILYQSPFNKKRIGKLNDGGYVITDLPGNYDIFLSGGISNDISFEEALLNIYPDLICYAFDGTINYIPDTNKNIKFYNKNLGNVNNETTTDLEEFMINYSNIFMKIDIEGHEFRIMPNIIEKNLISKVKQLIIEIHSPADISLYPNYFKGLQDIKNEHMFSLLNKLNNTHTLIHFHANNGCLIQTIDGIKLPHVFELTYIRNDFIVDKIRNIQPLPTPIDMINVLNKPDYFLEGHPYTI
uniref:Methyltransferase FkbM domain-containing protein n=1 Tax=viral metagenome TaxID=1070528 RepID=A0A6C0ICL3_9ZZZZ